ncbi:MAG: DUF2062 domain-containing protein [Bacteroidales bacterium]|nr:DUF2062 domain-containing protein [Bacteroidales bacterium]
MKNELDDVFRQLQCCVIIPTYNNDKTLAGVVEGALKYTDQIIVVNDGSTDSTKEILNNYNNITVINIPDNSGKGNALRTGFRKALELDYKNAITIDSDGQHNPDDLTKFIEHLSLEPETLVIGARNMEKDCVPGKSSFGNRFSNFWYWVETGRKLPDTQSGFRLYPIEKLKNMKFYTQKFEFEIEVIVRAAWKGIPVKSLPIEVQYFPKEKRVSHFRPFNDFTRISILNTILVLVAFLYAHPVRYFRDFNLQKLKILLGSGEPGLKLASAVGFGVFMGIVPIWGYQMITAAFLAHFLRLNKPLVLVASNISIPPMMPIIWYGSFVMGKFFVDNPVHLNFDGNLQWSNLKSGALQYILGSIVLAIIAGISAAMLSFIFITIRRRIRK